MVSKHHTNCLVIYTSECIYSPKIKIDIDISNTIGLTSRLHNESNGSGSGRRCLRVQSCTIPPSETHLIAALPVPFENRHTFGGIPKCRRRQESVRILHNLPRR